MHELLIAQTDRPQLLLGNEAIVRGALEGGVRFVAAYPGTPSSEIIDRFSQLGNEAGIYVEYSVNEKVSMEVACAAAVCGVRSLCAMKHVGLNVAADAFMTLAYVGVKAGMVIVVIPILVISREKSGTPTVRAQMVSLARDEIAYALVLVAILLTMKDVTWADPAGSIIIGVFIAFAAIYLFRENYAFLIGKAPDVVDAETTFCPKCRQPVIVREIFAVQTQSLAAGKCGACGERIAGVWS